MISSEGRFRALRDVIHKCDPPCVPYLGVYLTDLSFIEEATNNYIDDTLLNFSKMRMVNIKYFFFVLENVFTKIFETYIIILILLLFSV